MRKSLILLPLILAATPAVAKTSPQLPPELADPATAQKLGNAMQALSNAFLNLRLGEVQAAMEGREATPQERNITVREMARRNDPDFDRHFQQNMARVGPMVQQGMQTVNQTLPIVINDLGHAQKALERAIANLPDPTYPKR
ncbi:MAG: hypothetical protein ACJ8EH_09685 [Sphingomicrobium sp.]